jgi:sugar transferase (PEP-CTERM/EpsH1 system associated)
MRRLIDQVLAEKPYDLVYVHLFRMAPYAAGLSNLYRVIDLTDVISQEVIRSLPYRSPVWRLIYKLERPRIERYERWVARTFEESWLISEADHQVLTAACPGVNVRVVPNGVETSRFYPTGQPPEPNSLVFVGHLGVFHNVDAAVTLVEQILPRVRQRIPDCRLEIVGAEPSPRVQKLSQEPGVTVTGFVPDLNEYLNRAAVFVAPLRFAAGVQNKVLEAMAAGRPVVTSSVVNAGLGAQPGRDLFVADEVDAIVDGVVQLLQDERLRAQVGRAGLEFVLQKYNWDHVAKRVKEIERILQGPSSV